LYAVFGHFLNGKGGVGALGLEYHCQYVKLTIAIVAQSWVRKSLLK
jgi:hypothetical protein